MTEVPSWRQEPKDAGPKLQAGVRGFDQRYGCAAIVFRGCSCFCLFGSSGTGRLSRGLSSFSNPCYLVRTTWYYKVSTIIHYVKIRDTEYLPQAGALIHLFLLFVNDQLFCILLVVNLNEKKKALAYTQHKIKSIHGISGQNSLELSFLERHAPLGV